MRSVGAADYAGAVGTGAEVPGRSGGAARCHSPSGWRHAAATGQLALAAGAGPPAATDCETGRGLPYFDWSRSCSQ